MRASEYVPREKRPIAHPECPACRVQMWLARIEPDKPGHDLRTFECPRCQNEMTEVVRYR
jgi:hypothetical protein